MEEEEVLEVEMDLGEAGVLSQLPDDEEDDEDMGIG